MLPLVYLFVFLSTYSVAGTINAVCEENKNKTESLLHAELEASGCRECTIEGQNPTLRKTIKHSFDVIKTFVVTHPEINYKEDLDLNLATEWVSEEYEFGPRANDSRVNRANPLTQALLDLHSKYQFARSETGYKKIEDEFLNDLNKILSLIPKGKELLDCFENLPPHVQKQVTVTMALEDASHYSGHHQLSFSHMENGHIYYTSVITLNTSRRPLQVLGTYVHELAHACNLQGRLKYLSDLDRLRDSDRRAKGPNTPKKKKEAAEFERATLIEQTDQFAFLDEIRAYVIEAKIVQQLAAADPIHFCLIPKQNFFLESEKQLFFEKLEDTLADGSFSRLVLLHHLQSRKEILSQYSFFEPGDFTIKVDSDITLERAQKLKWRPDIKKKGRCDFSG